MDTVPIALCDTCRKTVSFYSRLLREIAIKNKIHIEITEFFSAAQFLYEMSAAPMKYKILFLNVALGSTDGILLAEHLRDMNCSLQIVFTASGTERTFDTFQIDPIAFIDTTTAGEAEVESAFLKAISRNEENRIYPVRTPSAILALPTDRIAYFEARGPMILVSCDSHVYISCDTISEIEKALPFFIRTGSNFLINLAFAERLERYKVILSTGQNIPLNLNRYQAVKEAFTEYLLNKT